MGEKTKKQKNEDGHFFANQFLNDESLFSVMDGISYYENFTFNKITNVLCESQGKHNIHLQFIAILQ